MDPFFRSSGRPMTSTKFKRSTLQFALSQPLMVSLKVIKTNELRLPRAIPLSLSSLFEFADAGDLDELISPTEVMCSASWERPFLSQLKNFLVLFQDNSGASDDDIHRVGDALDEILAIDDVRRIHNSFRFRIENPEDPNARPLMVDPVRLPQIIRDLAVKSVLERGETQIPQHLVLVPVNYKLETSIKRLYEEKKPSMSVSPQNVNFASNLEQSETARPPRNEREQEETARPPRNERSIVHYKGVGIFHPHEGERCLNRCSMLIVCAVFIGVVILSLYFAGVFNHPESGRAIDGFDSGHGGLDSDHGGSSTVSGAGDSGEDSTGITGDSSGTASRCTAFGDTCATDKDCCDTYHCDWFGGHGKVCLFSSTSPGGSSSSNGSGCAAFGDKCATANDCCDDYHCELFGGHGYICLF